jgi:hypothetical protein
MNFFYAKDGLTRAVPEETKITVFSAKSYPDGKRVLVNMEITPFQKRPNITVSLHNANGTEVASTTIIESMIWKLEFTLHVRGEILNPYHLIAKLYYPEAEIFAKPQQISIEVLRAPDYQPEAEIESDILDEE